MSNIVDELLSSSSLSRSRFLVGGLSAGMLAACSSGANSGLLPNFGKPATPDLYALMRKAGVRSFNDGSRVMILPELQGKIFTPGFPRNKPSKLSLDKNGQPIPLFVEQPQPGGGGSGSDCNIIGETCSDGLTLIGYVTCSLGPSSAYASVDSFGFDYGGGPLGPPTIGPRYNVGSPLPNCIAESIAAIGSAAVAIGSWIAANKNGLPPDILEAWEAYAAGTLPAAGFLIILAGIATSADFLLIFGAALVAASTAYLAYECFRDL